MAWEWVSPTVSGVVGTAGVVFGWLTARGAQRGAAEHDIRKTLREERRSAYLSYIECLRTVQDALRNLATGDGEVSALHSAVARLGNEALALVLVGPDSVTAAATATLTSAQDVALAAYRTTSIEPGDRPYLQLDSTHEGRLLARMREELGYFEKLADQRRTSGGPER